jgi:1,4-dihydroxy-2-naphthoate polyprenyltransferase
MVTPVEQNALESARQPSPVGTWLLAARPRTLPAAVVPVVVGTAAAIKDGGFALLPALAAFAVALLLQIAANFANDMFDFHRGADTAERLGPMRVTQSGLISPTRVLQATFLTVGLATLAGLYLVVRGGVPILLLGIAAVISTLAYTGGPFPLGYHGLGEVFVFVFFGLVGLAGTYYVQTLTLTSAVVVTAIPVGLLITAILVVNNLRDLETDRLAGKHTVAVRLGRTATPGESVLLLGGAYLAPIGLWLPGGLAAWWYVLPWLSLPLALRLVAQTRRETGRALNKTLAGTAQLALVFGLLLAVGLMLAP